MNHARATAILFYSVVRVPSPLLLRGRGGGIPFSLFSQNRKQDPQLVIWPFNDLKVLFLLSWPSARTLEPRRRQRVIFFLSELVIVVNCPLLAPVGLVDQTKGIARYRLATMVRGVPLAKVRPTDIMP